MTGDDIARRVETMDRYAGQTKFQAGTAIVVLFARFNCWNVLTLDQRHFRAVLAAGGHSFRLLPQDA